ncbi:MAG: alpha-L-fucosidase [Bacteroidota bacterium]
MKTSALVRHLTILSAVLALAGCSRPKHPIPTAGGAIARPSASAVAEWNGNKFSMFIHFGLYSLAGGVWNSEEIHKGYSEQIRAHAPIPREDYRKLARQFNPKNWNPDSVATLATAAGMRSVVITAKHHDGFAMFETEESDFNIVDATPYKRDIIGELAEACRRKGLKFGVYFSLIDWDVEGASPISDHNSDSIPPSHHQLNLRQVEELLTNYGPISEIWFDMGKPTAKQSQEIAKLVRKLQPDCMISGRLWHDQGDFAVMGDNASPDFRMGTLWQTPASMYDETWGYRSWQIRKDSLAKASEKIAALVRVVTNGGNYLLNIGPKGDGSIVPFERSVLKFMGQWMATNGSAIYRTAPLYLQPQGWGNATVSAGTINLFLLKPPADGIVPVRGLTSKIKRAQLLSDTTRILTVRTTAQGQVIDAGKSVSQSSTVQVINLTIDGPPDFIPDGVIKAEDDAFVLNDVNATRYHSFSGKDYYSTKPTVIRLEWAVQAEEEGIFQVRIRFRKEDKGKNIRITGSGPGFEILLAGQAGQDDDTPEVVYPDFYLQKGINRISLTLADQSNPHRDIGMEGIKLIIQR